jgi:tryptophan synthase alpha chain
MTAALSESLAARREGGGKLLIGYLMAGSTPDWQDAAAALVDAGVDAVEVGLAFSDPIMDGPVIQDAATRALEAGATLGAVAESLAARPLAAPSIVMTYCNVLLRPGYDEAASLLASAGVSGAILPDLALEELDDWQRSANGHGIETVLLAAPSTPAERLDALCARSQGFVYAVGTMATTGERGTLDPRGLELVAALRARTELPVCLGIGVSEPEQAAAVCEVADGVIVGSAIVRRMLAGESPVELGGFVRTLRAAID